MPSIIGSIPDADVAPIVTYLEYMNKAQGDGDYNERLLCLLLAWLAQ